VDRGLPEQHKMSGLEREDSSNGWAGNTPTCRWRKADERGRRMSTREREAGEGRGGEGGS
jgi:hypothetical protein